MVMTGSKQFMHIERRVSDPARPHPVRTASVPFIVLVSVFSRIFPALLRYLWVVITRFFLPQFGQKFFKRRRVVWVDHELDDHIAFDPTKVTTYLGFIQVWVRAASLMRWQLGRRSNPDIARFLHGLSDCYLEAWEVYRRCMSTTRRPAKAANRHFRMIYATDPHYCCVPSLHVMIVVYAVLQTQAVYEKHGRMDLGESVVEDLYQQAQDITETIIYVKQHSVNCIPAALFMISRLYPRFGRAQAAWMIGQLFRADLPAGEFEAIEAHIQALYTRFMDDPRAETGAYTDILVDFLLAYAADPAMATGKRGN